VIVILQAGAEHGETAWHIIHNEYRRLDFAWSIHAEPFNHLSSAALSPFYAAEKWLENSGKALLF
jgi:hypothetical protein